MNTDRNLLFGVLALQADLIDPARFAEACSAWAARKNTPLADLLVERGWLSAADRADIERILARKLARHDGDARASLAEVTTAEVRESLAEIHDPDIHLSLSGAKTPSLESDEYTTAYVPESFGRYTLTRLHALGGIGRVWLARDDILDRDVALKDLRPEQSVLPHLQARFLKEARITGRLEHPGIVPIYEVGRRADGQAPFYTMRFVRGRTLSAAVAAYHRRRAQGGAVALELRELLASFVAVCNTVAYAHSRGVLHRDLKPSNVVLGDYGEVIVLDWGLAKELAPNDTTPCPSENVGPVGRSGPEATPASQYLPSSDQRPAPGGESDETRQGQVLGTPAYMAPEQAEGRLDLLSCATDVYGLGAILYVILTGRPPFICEDKSTLLRQVIHEDPARPRTVTDDVPAALESVCLKALSKYSADRYASARELAAEVQRWLADEPVTACREPWTMRAARWARKRRTLVVGTAIFLLSVVVALSVGTALIWQEQRRTAEQKDQAEQQRDRAEKNFDAARQLSHRLIEIAEKKIAPLPQTGPVRAELLEAALATFQPFLAGRPDDPELQEHVALLYRYRANVRRLLGDLATAELSFRESIRLWEVLAAAENATLFRRIQLAETLRDFSTVQRLLGKLGAAADTLRRSLALAEPLRAAGLSETNSNRLLGTILVERSEVEHLRGQFPDAEQSCLRVAKIYSDLLAAPPGSRSAYDRLFLAMVLTRLGACRLGQGRPAEAIDAHERAIRHLRRMGVKQDSNVKHYLGRALVEQGRTLSAIPERHEEAEIGLNEAIGFWEELIKQFPQTPFYHEWQAIAFQARGELRIVMKRPELAAKDLERSRLILEGFVKQSPTMPGYRGRLGRTYAALARLEMARGNANEAAGWYKKAIESLRRAIEQDSENALHRILLDTIESEARRLAN
jgi:serine/threonine protein kinase/tetratricopeptide (TPR) repeat protein